VIAGELRVAGELTVPGDKSISHRSLICAALAEGTSRVRAVLQSADVHSTAGVLRALGVEIPPLADDLVIQGVGLRGLREPSVDLDCGNSGTSTRLLAGVVAGAGVVGRFVGRIARPLAAMGATVELPEHGGLPMTVRGAPLTNVEWVNETGSAQVKSCIMFAALCAGVEAKIVESPRSRDHTERMLASQGADVWVNEQSVLLHPVARLTPLDVVVPGDPSSAAFFAALAALAPRGELLLRRVCVNDTRIGFLAALREMGASIALDDRDRIAGEWIADVRVDGGATLRGISIGRDAIPTLIDELPLVACLAAYADGETRVTGAAELRVKESDRIAVVVGNLRTLGADAEELPDGFVVRGTAPALRGRVVTHGDHRMAMAFGILGALPGNDIEIDDRECVAVSYPTFWSDLAAVTGT